jgi:hypothetical protein
MDKKNLQELTKMGLSKKTISLMTESEVKLLFEKINKKKEAKEATQDVKKETKLDNTDVFNNISYENMQKLVKQKQPLKQETKNQPLDTKSVKLSDISNEFKEEIGEGKKKKKKYNPWAVCTASVGRKDKKKYEDCVMGVKKKLKEGKDPYEYIIESKMEEIVENHLAPKISKKELIQVIQEKKMMMNKPIGKSTMIGGEVGESETKEKEKVKTQPKTRPTSPNKKPSEAPHPAKAMMMKKETMEGETETETAPTRVTPKTDPGTRPSHPGKNPKPDSSPAPAKAKKVEIIKSIMKLLGTGK